MLLVPEPEVSAGEGQGAAPSNFTDQNYIGCGPGFSKGAPAGSSRVIWEVIRNAYAWGPTQTLLHQNLRRAGRPRNLPATALGALTHAQVWSHRPKSQARLFQLQTSALLHTPAHTHARGCTCTCTRTHTHACTHTHSCAHVQEKCNTTSSVSIPHQPRFEEIK